MGKTRHSSKKQTRKVKFEKGEIVIEELEKFQPTRRYWTPEEEAILKKYYRPGAARAIAQVLAQLYPPGRTLNAIHQKAMELGLTWKGKNG